MCRLRRIPNTARPESIKTSALNLVLCIPIQNAIKKAAFLSELPTTLYQQQTTNSTRQEIIWIYWHHNTFKLKTYLLSKVRFHPIENERLWEKMCNWWHLNRLRRSPLAGLWQDAFWSGRYTTLLFSQAAEFLQWIEWLLFLFFCITENYKSHTIIWVI